MSLDQRMRSKENNKMSFLEGLETVGIRIVC
jgi:hypothetical protein